MSARPNLGALLQSNAFLTPVGSFQERLLLRSAANSRRHTDFSAVARRFSRPSSTAGNEATGRNVYQLDAIHLPAEARPMTGRSRRNQLSTTLGSLTIGVFCPGWIQLASQRCAAWPSGRGRIADLAGRRPLATQGRTDEHPVLLVAPCDQGTVVLRRNRIPEIGTPGHPTRG